MSDTHIQIGPGLLGTAILLWLFALAVQIVHPASFPLWVMDLANVIVWGGWIILIIAGIIGVIAVIVILVIIVANK